MIIPAASADYARYILHGISDNRSGNPGGEHKSQHAYAFPNLTEKTD